jgi:ribonuclease HII
LLSDSTLGLVRNLVAKLPTIAPQADVYCDRHGGRRYYAAPLQHHFPDWLLRVVGESKQESKYSLSQNDSELEVHFTVKGDRFAPVAYSSLVAKYIRERFMESLNAYFASRHDGQTPLKPTAGYPVDADRFLKQIKSIRERESIADFDLVRMR